MLLLLRWEHHSLDSEIIENFCSKDFNIPKILYVKKKVWHTGLPFELRKNGLASNFLT